MQLTKPQSVYIDIRTGSGRKRKRSALTVYVDSGVENAADEVARLVRDAVDHGSSPEQGEPSVAGQIDSDLAAENSSKGSGEGRTE